MRGTVVEVKDVARLTMTHQLRDFLAEAQRRGVPLEIFTNAGYVSGTLRWLEQAKQVIISPIP